MAFAQVTGAEGIVARYAKANCATIQTCQRCPRSGVRIPAGLPKFPPIPHRLAFPARLLCVIVRRTAAGWATVPSELLSFYPNTRVAREGIRMIKKLMSFTAKVKVSPMVIGFLVLPHETTR